jgi:hypothetical protein
MGLGHELARLPKFATPSRESCRVGLRLVTRVLSLRSGGFRAADLRKGTVPFLGPDVPACPASLAEERDNPEPAVSCRGDSHRTLGDSPSHPV